MAKKEDANILQETLKEIEKSFGKGAIMKLGERPVINVDVIPSGSLGWVQDLRANRLGWLRPNRSPRQCSKPRSAERGRRSRSCPRAE